MNAFSCEMLNGNARALIASDLHRSQSRLKSRRGQVVEWPRRGRWVIAETANRVLVLYCRLPRPHLVAVGGS